MANTLKGEHRVTLADGRELTIVFDMEALIEAESVYGKPMAVMVAQAGAGFVGAVRALLYGATRAHHPELTVSDVSKLLETDGQVLGEALTTTHQAAMPAPESAEGNATTQKPRGQKPQRGKRSGSNGAKRA